MSLYRRQSNSDFGPRLANVDQMALHLRPLAGGASRRRNALVSKASRREWAILGMG
jgi:hypothetical protein